LPSQRISRPRPDYLDPLQLADAIVGIQLWDSIEQLQAYRDSAEFKQARKIGEKSVTFRAFVVEGSPH
jgi:heme-degrading monooxygenase HmoA